MTLRSRRKRQTTARSIQKTNLLNLTLGNSTKLRRVASVALAGTAIVALFAMLGSKAMADSTYRDRSAKQSTGRNGTKLKWLPYRPSARTVHRVAQNAREVARNANKNAREIELTNYQSSDQPDNQYDTGTSSLRSNAQPQKQNWELPPLEDPTPTRTESPSPTTSSPTTTFPTTTQEELRRPRSLPDDIRRDLDKRKSQSHYKDYQIPTVPEEMAEGLFKQNSDCPSEHDFKPIDELTDKVVIVDGDYPKECKLPWKDFEPRQWESTLFTWKASGLCSNPLYFEDVQLERYGHSWGPYIQPIISQGHFFVTVPFIPYKMGLNPPRECIYSLGYYRPGNCAPYMIDPLPLSIRAGLAETAAIMGGVYLFP